MINLYNSIPRVLIAIVIAGSIAGASPNKVDQCSNLSATVNKIRPITEKFEQEGKKFEIAAKVAANKRDLQAFKAIAARSAKTFIQLVHDFDQLIQEIEKVDVEDETLVSLKNQHIKNANTINDGFRTTSSVLITMSKVENSFEGVAELQRSVEILTETANRLESAVQEENTITSDFNRYCETR